MAMNYRGTSFWIIFLKKTIDKILLFFGIILFGLYLKLFLIPILYRHSQVSIFTDHF